MLYLDIHTHQPLPKQHVQSILSLSLTDGDLYPLTNTRPISVGLHPWFAKLKNLELQFENLKNKAQQPNVKMIGECGLDKLRGERLENQVIILEKQIALAEELNKPIILHCVKGFAELIEIKDRLKVKVPMILHGFNKNVELGKQLIDKGFMLSFGTSILRTDSGAAKLIQDTDNFFLETDDSLTPIEEIYDATANLKKCSVDELKARIFADWKKLSLL
ncbi:TatD family hydrolase [Pedobacter fastidiosus]|uniref:TatD family hydrolase n=1 Tax=Pedobacter fastidiosus TaxID=2765361 RepID=A0ABR7KL70_9SPHI|nr:TatD family hydrolase [Pedobacter fastidiosus]MBC6108820.1 TatD family hydrolase [Pedobacter fastidiosus]